eukprot:6147806-Pleurochrysis_carterae.AAC.1
MNRPEKRLWRLTKTRNERSRAGLARGWLAEGSACKLSDSTIATRTPEVSAGCPLHPLQT